MSTFATGAANMSLQINLSSREISEAYQNVLNNQGIDWAIFTYEGRSNDLKVQATGSGGLEELEEEFSDGRRVLSCQIALESLTETADRFRVQYAYVRVIEPNVRDFGIYRGSVQLSKATCVTNRASSPSWYRSIGVEMVYP